MTGQRILPGGVGPRGYDEQFIQGLKCPLSTLYAYIDDQGS